MIPTMFNAIPYRPSSSLNSNKKAEPSFAGAAGLLKVKELRKLQAVFTEGLAVTSPEEVAVHTGLGDELVERLSRNGIDVDDTHYPWTIASNIRIKTSQDPKLPPGLLVLRAEEARSLLDTGNIPKSALRVRDTYPGSALDLMQGTINQRQSPSFWTPWTDRGLGGRKLWRPRGLKPTPERPIVLLSGDQLIAAGGPQSQLPYKDLLQVAKTKNPFA